MNNKKDEVIDAEVENDCPGKIELARQSAIVKPVDVEGTLEAYRQFEEIKKKLLGDNDYMWFDENGKPAERNGGNPYIKKSGWRKIKTAFGVSIEYLNEGIRTEGEDAEGKYYVWRYKVRAITPNGIYQDADGAASSRKAFFSKKYGKRVDPEEEDIILTAQTVAINRAISDLVGGGEVSAEEMIGKNQITTQKEIKSQDNKLQELDPKTFKVPFQRSKYVGLILIECPLWWLKGQLKYVEDNKFIPSKFGYDNEKYKDMFREAIKVVEAEDKELEGKIDKEL